MAQAYHRRVDVDVGISGAGENFGLPDLACHFCGGSATLGPPYGTAAKHQVGWNKRSGSTDPPSVALYGGSAALDPPYGSATKHHVRWNKQSGSTDPPSVASCGGSAALDPPYGTFGDPHLKYVA